MEQKDLIEDWRKKNLTEERYMHCFIVKSHKGYVQWNVEENAYNAVN